MSEDASGIGEILNEVSDKIPKLLNGVLDTLYSAESGKKMGQAVGTFYRELLDAGIPQEDALKMAREYMISIKGVTESAFNGNNNNGSTGN